MKISAEKKRSRLLRRSLTKEAISILDSREIRPFSVFFYTYDVHVVTYETISNEDTYFQGKLPLTTHTINRPPDRSEAGITNPVGTPGAPPEAIIFAIKEVRKYSPENTSDFRRLFQPHIYSHAISKLVVPK